MSTTTVRHSESVTNVSEESFGLRLKRWGQKTDPPNWIGPPQCFRFWKMTNMSKRSCKPKEIIAKLRQVDVLHSQGSTISDAIRQIGVNEVTFYRRRKEYGGMKKTDQLKRLKELEKENERLRRAVSDLTLDKLILKVS